MTKILMVCLGNICRSPLAEGILKAKLPDNEFFVDSAGTSSYHIGDQPDRRSVEIAEVNNINISSQQARQFIIEDFDQFDLIYAMDSSNYQSIIKLARNNHDFEKVKFILDEIPDVISKDVPDPYYGGDKGFENVFNLLEKACKIVAAKLVKE